jgi:hypothetical protein
MSSRFLLSLAILLLLPVRALAGLSLAEAKAASGVDPRVPAWLPGGYALESLVVVPRGKKQILHFRFTDGAHALSLFECPPRTRLGFPRKGVHRLRLKSGPARLMDSPDGPVLGWSSGGTRFLLVGPLGREDLQRVAESIP